MALGDPTAPLIEDAPLPAWRVWLLYATVALMSLSFNIGPWVHPKKMTVNFSPLDPLLLILSALLLWDIWRGRARPWWPPGANLVWAGLALLSGVWAVQAYGMKAWVKEAVLGPVLIGLCAVWVFRHATADTKLLRRLMLILGASVGVCFLYALYQYIQPQGRPLATGETDLSLAGGVTHVRVAGWYLLRGQMAGLVAMLVPAAAAVVVLERDSAVRVSAGAFALLGLCVCLSGSGVVGAVAGVVAVAAALGARQIKASPDTHAAGLWARVFPAWHDGVPAAILFAVLALTLGVVLPQLPRDNPAVLWDSLTLYRDVETDAGPEARPTARLRRYQAAMNLLRHDDQWKRGVGPGGYQQRINEYYVEPYYPKPGRNTDDEAAFDMEADELYTHGLFETQTVELGVPGGLAVGWLFLAWVAAALGAFLRSEPGDTEAQMLALAALGAGVGAGVFALFGDPTVRGCAGSFAFWMGTALALNRRAAPQAGAFSSKDRTASAE